MKRIISIFALCLVFAVAANAQSVSQSLFSEVESGVNLTDTITNAGTVKMTSSVVKGTPNTTTVTATFTKLTGTVAGVATLKGSINNVDFATASSTTYTVTDVASQTNAWQITGSPFLYFRVETVGSGTSAYTVKGQVLTRNP